MPKPTPPPWAGKAARVPDQWGHHPTPTPLTPPTSPAPLGRSARPAREAGGYCPRTSSGLALYCTSCSRAPNAVYPFQYATSSFLYCHERLITGTRGFHELIASFDSVKQNYNGIDLLRVVLLNDMEHENERK